MSHVQVYCITIETHEMTSMWITGSTIQWKGMKSHNYVEVMASVIFCLVWKCSALNVSRSTWISQLCVPPITAASWSTHIFSNTDHQHEHHFACVSSVLTIVSCQLTSSGASLGAKARWKSLSPAIAACSASSNLSHWVVHTRLSYMGHLKTVL